MTTQPKSSPNIGQASTDNETSSNAGGTILSESTSSAADFHAKTFPTPGEGQDWTESEADCFLKPFAWFANYDRERLCWRTLQGCLLEGWTEFSGRWPRSGMMRNGIAYRLPPLVPRISGTGCSFWPTPNSSKAANDITLQCSGDGRSKPNKLGWAVGQSFPTPTSRMHKDNGKSPSELNRNSETLAMKAGGQLNPQWVEWLMGFPIGWTDCEDSETQ